MTKTDIGIYRGLKEKFDPEVHVGFFITTDTGELLLGDQSLGQTISGWEINDGVLTLKLNTGKDIRVTFPEATETVKGLLSAADKAQLNVLQANLDSKVDKVTGKSLLADSEIEKLAGLPNSTELTNSIATAKAAGDNAQSDLNAHKQNKSNPHEVTKAQVGLGNVTNDAQVKRSEMGVANGVATLDADGKVPAAQLPSYVDDIIDVYATYSKSDTGVLSNVTLYLDAAHTQLVTGEAGKIYQNIADGEPQYQFRWTGTIFSQTGASSLILGEVTGTAYDGAKGKANADNIAKIKGTSLSHIKDAAPVTTAADKVSLNYECFEGNQYGAAGTDHTADIPAATTAKAGVMSAADKTKLDGIEAGAQVNTVTSVAGKTGAVALAKADVGLGNVDNTSDANKPVSTAQATAIADAKKAGTNAQTALNTYKTQNDAAVEAVTTDLANHKLDKDKKHIPSGGHERQILAWEADGSAKWDDLANMFTGLEELLAYGVEWKENVADPYLTRIGNMSLHKTLPIQSQLKGCIAQNDKIMYWLDENNWRYKKGYKDVRGADYTENLLLGSNVIAENQEYLTGSYSIVDQSLTDGEDVTVTIWGELGSDRTTFVVYNSGGLVNLGATKVSDGIYKWTGKWKTRSSSDVAIADNTTLRVYAFPEATTPSTTSKITKIKLERGTNANPVWTPAESETDDSVLARLDGYDGTVRVYCPAFYIKSKSIGNKRQVWLSTVKIDNTWTYQHEILIDAYRSTVLNTVPENMGYLSTLPVNSAISVVNTAAYCRGGNNRTAYDKYLEGVEASEGVEAVAKDIFRTDLGKPRTNHPRSSMRTEARNAGSEMLSYDQYKNIFYWLYVVEYANFNCQEAYNAELTDDGYHQGGLGNGVTNVSNWQTFNDYYPITPCGYGNDLGNGTGVKLITSPGLTPANGVYMCRWRGFDNPFGDIWTNLDGIIIDADADNHPNNMNYVYTCQDPEKYADNLNGEGYEKVGEEVHQDGYTKLFDLGDAAHIIPNVMGGNTTQYKCDYHWTGSKNTTLRTLIVGGSVHLGAGAGLGFFYSDDSVSNSWHDVGFRSVSRFVSFSSQE